MNWLLRMFGYTTPEPPQLPAVCCRCLGRSGMAPIEGDGVLICLGCLWQNGRAAADPSSLTEGEASMLAEAHGDVVQLVWIDLPTGGFRRWWWKEPQVPA